MDDKTKVKELISALGIDNLLYYTRKKSIREILEDISCISSVDIKFLYMRAQFELYIKLQDFDPNIHSALMKHMWVYIDEFELYEFVYFDSKLNWTNYKEIFEE